MGPLQREAVIEDALLTAIAADDDGYYMEARQLWAGLESRPDEARRHLLSDTHRPSEAVQRRMDELADDAADALRRGMP